MKLVIYSSLVILFLAVTTQAIPDLGRLQLDLHLTKQRVKLVTERILKECPNTLLNGVFGKRAVVNNQDVAGELAIEKVILSHVTQLLQKCTSATTVKYRTTPAQRTAPARWTTPRAVTPRWWTASTPRTVTPRWRTASTPRTVTPRWRTASTPRMTTPWWWTASTPRTVTPRWRTASTPRVTTPWWWTARIGTTWWTRPRVTRGTTWWWTTTRRPTITRTMRPRITGTSPRYYTSPRSTPVPITGTTSYNHGRSLPHQCTSSKTVNLNESWRNGYTGRANHSDVGVLDEGRMWFRFTGAAGTRLRNRCPVLHYYSCGSSRGYWSDNKMPAGVGETAKFYMYESTYGRPLFMIASCKTQGKRYSATVTRCSSKGDFVYRLDSPMSPGRYTVCGMN